MDGTCDAADSGYYSEPNRDDEASRSHDQKWRSQSSTPAAIDRLGRSTRRLVDCINKLAEYGIESHNKPLPKIAVIGDQSAGKSSLIEAISEIEVPRSSGTCTRCVLQINLSPATSSSWTLSLVHKYNYLPGNRGRLEQGDFREWQMKPQPETITSVHLEQSQVKNYLERAQAALLCPQLDQAAILRGSQDAHQTVSFSPNIIKLDISGPSVHTLTLYDLPGIINQSAEGERTLPDLVQGLARKYACNPNTVVVLACPFNVDMETSTAASLVRKWKATDRTLGVLTKPDNLPPGDDPQQWLSVLGGKRFHVGHGYFVTKQPSSAELKVGISHLEARQEEDKFFQKSPWKDTFRTYTPKFGTAALQAKLSELLAAEIATYLPGLKVEVKNELSEVEQQLSQLPAPSQNPYATVIETISKFHADMSHWLQGDLPKNQLMKEWRDLGKTLLTSLKEMHPLVVVNTGRESQWKFATPVINLDDDEGSPDPGSKRSSSIFSSEDTSNKRMKSSQPTAPSSTSSSSGRLKFTLAEIKSTISAMATSGVPSDSDPRAEEYLINQSLKNWDVPVRKYLEAIRSAIVRYLDEVVHTHASPWLNTKFPNALENAAHSCLGEVCDAHEANVLSALNAELFKPYTASEDLLLHITETQLKNLKTSRQQARAKAYILAKDKSSNKANADSADVQRRIAAVKPQELGDDPYEAQIQIMARIRGYYNLAAATLTDSLAKKSQSEVFDRFNRELKGALSKSLGTDEDAETGIRNCRMLLAEDEERERSRERFVAQKDRLGKALSLLDGLRV